MSLSQTDCFKSIPEYLKKPGGDCFLILIYANSEAVLVNSATRTEYADWVAYKQ